MRNRAGAALAVALFALVAVAAIVAAILAPAVAHRRTAARTSVHEGAIGAAESALGALLHDWPRTRWLDMAVGTTWSDEGAVTGTSPRIPPGTASVRREVRRLTDAVFALSTDVTAGALVAPVSVERLLLVELRADSGAVGPVLTAGGTVDVADGDAIGVDPACPPDAGEPSGLVRVANAMNVRWAGADDGDVVEEPAAADANTYSHAAGLDVDALGRSADIVLPGGASVDPMPVADSGCVEGANRWGEPLRAGGTRVTACVSRYPIVRADGDLRVGNGRGQGILIVAGRLRITGPFHYAGVIIASGGIETDGGPVTLVGALFTGPAASAVLRAAPTLLQRNGCAVREAARGAARVVPIAARPWG